MKKLTLISACVLFSLGIFAQGGKYGATPQDSIKCVEGLSLYKDFLGKDDKAALQYWRVPYTLCPQSSEKMYLDGINIFSNLIQKEKDAATKQKYVDTLLQVYDNRIANFGKEGFVRGRKGVDMLRYRPEQPEAAFAELAKSIELQAEKSEAAVLASYIQLSADLEKAGKRKKEEVVEDYGLVSEYADYNVANNEKNREFYTKAQENIDVIAAPYLSCEVLLKSLGEKFESNKENLNWLKKSETLLSRKGCTEQQPYFKIAESLYKLEPSASAAASMAKMYVGQKNYSKANEFFKQAVEQETDNAKKAEYTLFLAKVALINGQGETAKNYALKAASLRSGWGEPYLIIGTAYASAAGSCAQNECEKGLIYVAAVEQFTKAKSVDGSVSAEANKEINKYNKYYPSNKDCFFHGIQEGSSYKIGCWINETVTVKTQ